MKRHPIDEVTAERLLAGNVEPDDAPPGYAEVATLVKTAKAPATPEELVRRDADVSMMTAALASPATASTTSEGTRMISSRFGAKALAIAIPALALTATGAAAATGSLPAPAQSTIHGALAHVGLSVPSGSHTNSGDTGDTGNTGTHSANNANAVGPDATGAAKFGLCRAFIASNGHPNTNSVAFRNLEKAAGSESVAAFCAGVTPGNGTVANTGTTGSAGNNTQNSGDVPGTRPGKASSAPPSSTPGSDHRSTSTPPGPPSSTPGSDQRSTSTPAGPPTSTPGSDHTSTSTPAGPPTSTPAGRP
jgi:hypothetical protein